MIPKELVSERGKAIRTYNLKQKALERAKTEYVSAMDNLNRIDQRIAEAMADERKKLGIPEESTTVEEEVHTADKVE